MATAGVARSLLFVPANRPERFAKAAASGADEVIIDIEDAVAPHAKEAGLVHALRWLESGGHAVVRVNGIGTPWHAAEVIALARTGAMLMVPKAEDTRDLAALGEAVGDRVLALIETARGVRDADAVCATPGVVRVALGNVDLAHELGVDPASRTALAYARGRIVAASAAARLASPVDGVTTALDEAAVLDGDIRAARELGFTGKLCVHPRQVAAVNEGLSPSPEELAWARRIVDQDGATRGVAGGVTVVDGAMVDAPVVARAQALLRRTETPS